MSKFLIMRQQESELPIAVNVVFINLDMDYQQGNQSAMRSTPTSNQRVNTNVPIVFTDVQAKAIAEKMLYNVWVERDRFRFKLPRKYAFLEPADVIALKDDEAGLVYSVRLITVTESRNGELEIEACADQYPTYSHKVVTTGVSAIPQTAPVSSLTNAVFLDIPPLKYEDVGMGWYVALAGQTTVWAGGGVYLSLDGGDNYSMITSANSPATFGTATTALGTVGAPTIGMEDVEDRVSWDDETNMVTVEMDSGTLASTTYAGISSGLNMAALKAGAHWEIIQFRNATLVSNPGDEKLRYTLSGLRRAGKATRYCEHLHAVGDKFVLLNSALKRISMDTAHFNVPLQFKVATNGQSLGAVSAVTLTNTGNALKSSSGLFVISTSVQPNGDIRLDIQQDIDAYAEVMGHKFDYLLTPSYYERLYDFEIYSDATFTTLKRTYSNVAQTDAGYNTKDAIMTYLAADQITDFGAAPTTLYMRVYVKTDVVGRNHSADYIIPIPYNA